MEHNLDIILILTVGFVLASFFGYAAQRLHLPAIIGYLLAGFIIGPYSPGYVADQAIAEKLASIGVVLMLFGVGLHFKFEHLMSVKNIVIPGAILQTLAATVVTTYIVHMIGWPWINGIILGLSIGVASTVVLVRILTERNLLNTTQGHIAVAWLVVEDIVTVLILIMLPTIAAFSTGQELSAWRVSWEVLFAVAKFIVLALIMFTYGHKVVAYVLTSVAKLRSHELFTLSVLAVVFLIAMGSTLVFGTSIALGAFIAGMVIGKTDVRHQAAANALPLKDMFAIIFFLSVGMIFNPMAVPENLTLFLGLIFVILIIKPLTAYLITLLFGYSLKVALTVAVSLAQIGEFSFILSEEALILKILPDEGYDILVACSFISISINPLLFQCLDFFENVLRKMAFKRKGPSEKLLKGLKLRPKVVIIGYGSIGRESATLLERLGYLPSIIEQNIDTVLEIEENELMIFGDASDENILKEAKLEEAGHLIITVPDIGKTVEIVHAARQLNPKIKIIARVQNINEIVSMEELYVQYICSENEALKAFRSLIQSSF